MLTIDIAIGFAMGALLASLIHVKIPKNFDKEIAYAIIIEKLKSENDKLKLEIELLKTQIKQLKNHEAR
jgi:cell division protein FtsB